MLILGESRLGEYRNSVLSLQFCCKSKNYSKISIFILGGEKKKLREESPESRNLLGVESEGEGGIKMMSKSSA